MSAFSQVQMSAFSQRKLTSRRRSGAGGFNGCDRTDNHDDARTGQVQGHSGRRRRQAQAVARGRTAQADDAADPAPGCATARTWTGRPRVDRALSIIRDRYVDFGPTLACEKLYECHGIRLAKETVRRLMTDAGLWVPRRQRPPKIYQPRARRACLGELIQIDGCDHRWFEERAPACSLLVYVDDATSQLMMLHFTATESTFSYFEATRAYIERHGKPVAFYSDKYSVFRKTGANKDGNSVTHFGRAMYELNIDTFCANSSPAKGRVARAHLTLQDRLVKELRLRGISTVCEANAYAPAFMAA